jgi:hypothetical protein
MRLYSHSCAQDSPDEAAPATEADSNPDFGAEAASPAAAAPVGTTLIDGKVLTVRLGPAVP